MTTAASFSNIGSLHQHGGDVAFRNYGGTDIPATSAVIFDVANPPDGTKTTGVIIPATSGAVTAVAGVALTTIPAGGIGVVRQAGSAVAIASGTITVGDILMIDSASGKEGRVKTQTTAGAQIGYAMASATDGENVLVNLSRANNAL